MIFLVALVVDQILKIIVIATDCNITLLPNIFNFMYVKNTGGVYGIGEGNNNFFLIVSMLIISVLTMYYVKKIKLCGNKFKKITWQFIIAGGVGNLIDRVFRGFVVDYVQMICFGVFNLADVFIVFGIIAVFIMEVKEIVSENNRKESN